MWLVILLMIVGLGLLTVAGICLFKLFYQIYVRDLPPTSIRTWGYSVLTLLFLYPSIMLLHPSLSRFFGLPSSLDKYLDPPEVVENLVEDSVKTPSQAPKVTYSDAGIGFKCSICYREFLRSTHSQSTSNDSLK